MFLDFLYALREGGIRVSTTEWLTLMEALSQGHARANLSTLYYLARAVLVKRESEFDRYDQVFAAFFEGVEQQFDLSEDLLQWLQNPILPRQLSPEELAKLKQLDLQTLREEFERRMKEQKERHDGGNHWVGTGGTSPFGQGGTNPAGVRVGSGGQHTAAQVATERRCANLRTDRVLDTRQMGTALRRLRRLARDGAQTELDVDRTIEKTGREAGEITLVYGPERRNRLKLLLLMDVGGSMDPYAALSERLFGAAHAATHFKAFKSLYFHNCVYDELFLDMANMSATPTMEVLRQVDETWRLMIVGDAYMHPYEVLYAGGAIDYRQQNQDTGLQWLQRLRQRIPQSVWLNPSPRGMWNAQSTHIIRTVFPMYPFTVDGLTEAVDLLRGRGRNQPDLPPLQMADR